MLERVMRVAKLYDFYGALLTEKQQQYLELHYLSDYSLAEIAEEFAVSRQAVHDILRRGELILEDYERRLGLLMRHDRDRKSAEEALEALSGLPEVIRKTPEIQKAVVKLQELIDRGEEPG